MTIPTTGSSRSSRCSTRSCERVRRRLNVQQALGQEQESKKYSQDHGRSPC